MDRHRLHLDERATCGLDTTDAPVKCIAVKRWFIPLVGETCFALFDFVSRFVVPSDTVLMFSHDFVCVCFCFPHRHHQFGIGSEKRKHISIMTVKRRNHGRNKHGRGHVNRVRCVSTGKAIPKDKAVKRFIVRNIVDASSLRDIKEASAYKDYQLPKLYLKMFYCVEAAVHQRVVRGRSRENRRIRSPPPRFGARS